MYLSRYLLILTSLTRNSTAPSSTASLPSLALRRCRALGLARETTRKEPPLSQSREMTKGWSHREPEHWSVLSPDDFLLHNPACYHPLPPTCCSPTHLLLAT